MRFIFAGALWKKFRFQCYLRAIIRQLIKRISPRLGSTVAKAIRNIESGCLLRSMGILLRSGRRRAGAVEQAIRPSV
jgi:hypothetical protein